MRLDMDELLKKIQGTELGKRFAQIRALEKHTLLMPPYALPDLKQLVARAQKELNATFIKPYCHLLMCCDGGALFTTDMFSVYDTENDDNDIVTINQYLWEEGLIPERYVAIAMEDYGDYVCINRDGKSEQVVIWGVDERVDDAVFDSVCAWLDDEINKAKYLLADDLLPTIEDDEEDA